MADTDLTGQQAASQTPAPDSTTPEAPLTEGKFAGKSAADIAAAYDALESKLGEQGKELGGLRQQNTELTGYLRQIAEVQARQAAPQQPPLPDGPTAWDWDKPLDAVEKVAAKTTDKKLNDFYRFMRTQQAQTQSQYAKVIAKQQFPHLFTGDNEQAVDSFMQNALRSGQVDPALVENPNMWAAIAYVQDGMKQGFRPAGGVSPVSPGFGETPRGGRAPEYDDSEPVTLEPEHELMIKQFGFKKEEIEKELREEKRQSGKKARR